MARKAASGCSPDRDERRGASWGAAPARTPDGGADASNVTNAAEPARTAPVTVRTSAGVLDSMLTRFPAKVPPAVSRPTTTLAASNFRLAGAYLYPGPRESDIPVVLPPSATA